MNHMKTRLPGLFDLGRRFCEHLEIFCGLSEDQKILIKERTETYAECSTVDQFITHTQTTNEKPFSTATFFIDISRRIEFRL